MPGQSFSLFFETKNNTSRLTKRFAIAFMASAHEKWENLAFLKNLAIMIAFLPDSGIIKTSKMLRYMYYKAIVWDACSVMPPDRITKARDGLLAMTEAWQEACCLCPVGRARRMR